ncbi:MFS transporter [Niveibacterium sp. SC-1]|uniref:MFS transporter n=1 Tax=Niveibacterium sp. SC-1 TaxID=3135646 RepID=UPI00311EC36F
MENLNVSPTRAPTPDRHRWKVLGIGVAANACFSAALAGVPSTAVAMRADYGLDNAALGLALGMLGLGVALSEVPWGMATDRLGDRRILLVGLGLSAAWLCGMALFCVPHGTTAPTLVALCVGLLLAGVFAGSVNGASGRAVMAWFAEGERGFAMSIRQTAVPLGGGLGALVLPGLAQHHGFRVVFGALALASLVTAVLTWRWLHEAPGAQGVAAASAERRGKSPLRSGVVWRLAAGIGLLCMPQVAVLSFTSVFLHDFAGLGVMAISVSLGCVQAGAMVSRVWSGRWTDRRGNRRGYMQACCWGAALLFGALGGLAALAQGHGSGGVTLSLLLLTLVIAGICVSAWHGVAFTELATLAGTQRAATALALGNTCAFAGFFIVPLLVPALQAGAGWPGVWWACVACALMAAIAFPSARRIPVTGRCEDRAFNPHEQGERT